MNKRSNTNALLATLMTSLLSAALANAADENREAKPTSDMPHAMDTGNMIGPQPGPQRELPKPHNPWSEDAEAISEGRRLFVWFNCSGCHGGNAGGGMGPSLRDVAWIYGSEPEDIYSSIVQGRANGMPGWGHMLPPEQIWKMTAYIEALGTDREPNPPPENPVYPNPPSEEAGNERLLEEDPAEEHEN